MMKLAFWQITDMKLITLWIAFCLTILLFGLFK